jgi:hypothetical protein
MIVSYQDARFAVNFYYNDTKTQGRKSLSNANKKKITTTCAIKEMLKEKDGKHTYKDLTMESCTKYSKDIFNKATGRRTALSKALASFPRDFRKCVWQQYFKEHRDIKV